jgi:peptide methionine sulfoxide reductase msrA/msrB
LAVLAIMVGGCNGREQSRADANLSARKSPAAASQTRSSSGADISQEEPLEMVRVRVINEAGELVGPVNTAKVIKSDAEWRKQLTPEQYRITRGKGTERPFCGTLLDNHLEGVYTCVCCGLPLFSSAAKFNSGTGWPSFFQPIAPENIAERPDYSYGLRTEILCARCGDSSPFAKAVFAGGCFWCVEAVFEELEGVIDVTSGYAGGDAQTANYKAVCSGRTGHAEAVQITYDPSKISYETLLKVHFATHDPTSLNQQGNDIGTQYRSAIFYSTEQEKEIAQAFIDDLTDAKVFSKPIVTTLEPLKPGGFYPAETYHQNYVCHNPTQSYVQAAALPKVAKVREKFKDLLKAKSPLTVQP